MSTSEHAMMACENLEEPINENESDSEDRYSTNNEENSQKNSAEGEEADDEFSESSYSTDYDLLEQERIRRQYSFTWQYKDGTTMYQNMELEGNSQKKMSIPETSSEKPLEHSEIANNKTSFSCYPDIHTKNKKAIPTKNKTKNWTLH